MLSLSFWIQLYCDNNWYGIDCSTYCVPVNQSNIGHYGCDPDTGEKVCLDGEYTR